MRKTLLIVLGPSLLTVTALAQTQQSTFVDIPPCHWAAAAVAQVSSADRPRPDQSARLVANAFEQVFSGVQCGNAEWVSRFVNGLPASFSLAEGTLRSFELQALETRIQGQSATLRYRLTLNLASGVVTRTGTARLTADATSGWRVAYTSLLELKLPFFP